MARSVTPASDLLLPQSVTPPRTGLLAWGRALFRGAPVFSLCFLTLAVVCAVGAPLLAPYDPIQTNRAETLLAPGLSAHLLGTDHLGRDILSRLIYGARISVTVGFLAVFVSGTLGTLIALLSGVLRGWADTVLMRLTDAFLALPFLMVAVPWCRCWVPAW
jgi:peptide/nickel transport system permease protein